jgi:hypothetical protein
VKRFLLLWMLLGFVGTVVTAGVMYFITHDYDLRFEPFLALMLAPAVNSALLLYFFPTLRDQRFTSPARALAPRWRSTAASVLLLAITALTLLIAMGVVPGESFDLLRGALVGCAAAAFVVAWRRRASGALPGAILFALVAVSTNQTTRLAQNVLTNQPLVLRWIVFYALTTLIFLIVFFRLVTLLRDSSLDAATLLEWSLAPMMAVAVIVIGNVFWRPSLTPLWWQLANFLGCVAAALVLLAALIAARREVR